MPARVAAPAAPAAPKLVMIVDDSLTVRKVTSRVLAREGYEVAAARDGVEALEQMQDLVPDALLVDVEMPRMDGFELTRRVRANARLAHLQHVTAVDVAQQRPLVQIGGLAVHVGAHIEHQHLLFRVLGGE